MVTIGKTRLVRLHVVSNGRSLALAKALDVDEGHKVVQLVVAGKSGGAKAAASQIDPSAVSPSPMRQYTRYEALSMYLPVDVDEGHKAIQLICSVLHRI